MEKERKVDEALFLSLTCDELFQTSGDTGVFQVQVTQLGLSHKLWNGISGIPLLWIKSIAFWRFFLWFLLCSWHLVYSAALWHPGFWGVFIHSLMPKFGSSPPSLPLAYVNQVLLCPWSDRATSIAFPTARTMFHLTMIAAEESRNFCCFCRSTFSSLVTCLEEDHSQCVLVPSQFWQSQWWCVLLLIPVQMTSAITTGGITSKASWIVLHESSFKALKAFLNRRDWMQLGRKSDRDVFLPISCMHLVHTSSCQIPTSCWCLFPLCFHEHPSERVDVPGFVPCLNNCSACYLSW